jgi:hypothetical protein
MSEQTNDIFQLTAAGLFAFDGEIPIEELYQAFKKRMITEIYITMERGKLVIEDVDA